MKKITLGNTDLSISNICYGTGNYGDGLLKEDAFYMLDAFTDMGGTFIDTANVYCRWVPGMGNSSEQYVGAWLRERKTYDKVVIATKGAHYDFNQPEISRVTKKDIIGDLEDSRKTLGIDCIDFYWLHRDDERVPAEEIVDWMEELVKEGKIRYYGASNFKQYRVERANAYAKERGFQGFSAVSNQWSLASVNPGKNMNSDPTLVLTDDDYYQWHVENKMPLVPFSSGAHGFLSKYVNGVPMSADMQAAYLNERNIKIANDLKKIAEEKQCSVHTLSIACLMQQPFQVVPILAVSKKEQLKDFEVASEIVL